MAKSISQKSFLTKLYTLEQSKVFSMKNIFFLPTKKVFFTFNHFSESTYTRGTSSPDKFRIHFGGKMIAQIAGLPKTFGSAASAKSHIRDADKTFQGLYYHEIGHLLYTDMDSRLIADYKEAKYRGFLHTLFNIFEDIVIERYGMAEDYPYTAKYFAFLVKRLFIPQCKLYEDNPADPRSFLNFLLLKLRCGKAFTGVSTVWEDHKKDLIRLSKDIMMEEDPTRRIEKTIVMGEYLINNTELDFTTITEPQDTNSGSLSSAGTSGGVGAGSGLKPKNTRYKGNKKGKKKSNKGEQDGVGASTESDEPGKVGVYEGESMNTEDSPDSDIPKQGGSNQNRGMDSGDPENAPDLKTLDELDTDPQEESELNDTYDSSNDLLIDNCPEIDDAFNEVLDTDDNHQFMIAKNYYEPSSDVIQAIEERIIREGPLATSCKAAFSLFRSQIRPRYNRGFTSGRLDINRAMQNSLTNGCDLKLFQKKVSNGVAADLAVSILCDNSGSMSGNKSVVCTMAMIALAKACQMCSIPLEISCFTHGGGMNYTIRMKQFSDTFDEAKPYLGITDSNIIRGYRKDEYIPNFYGNEDEVNLYYIWREFRRNKHKDKLIIVISDGETCGSTGSLGSLVKDIEKDGISVIGLGIQSKAVTRSYGTYQLFDTEESLSQLPEFLTSTLLQFAKGGK